MVCYILDKKIVSFGLLAALLVGLQLWKAKKTRMNVNSFQDRENAQALPSNRPSIAKHCQAQPSNKPSFTKQQTKHYQAIDQFIHSISSNYSVPLSIHSVTSISPIHLVHFIHSFSLFCPFIPFFIHSISSIPSNISNICQNH